MANVAEKFGLKPVRSLFVRKVDILDKWTLGRQNDGLGGPVASYDMVAT